VTGNDNSEEIPFMKLSRSFLSLLILTALVSVFGFSTARAEDTKALSPLPGLPDFTKDKPLPDVFDKKYPDGIQDLKTIETHVKEVLKKVIPATVCVQVGQSSGSGVIVSEDGMILTAGHVSDKPGLEVTVIMPDGKKLQGKTLGHNTGIDSGMMKITDEGKYPFVEMGKSADLKKGTWVITTGHPGGYHPGRSPVVRVGQILEVQLSKRMGYIRTDCTLVGGDSGGPLFDMQGRVIGIHSRIGGQITSNMHVPIDTFRETWDRLVASEKFDGSEVGEPYFGIGLDQVDNDCIIGEVKGNSPAAKAGLKEGDIVKKFDGKEVENKEALREMFEKKKPKDEVMFEIQRGEEVLKLKVVVGKKG
jgi:serine protease Do